MHFSFCSCLIVLRIPVQFWIKVIRWSFCVVPYLGREVFRLSLFCMVLAVGFLLMPFISLRKFSSVPRSLGVFITMGTEFGHMSSLYQLIWTCAFPSIGSENIVDTLTDFQMLNQLCICWDVSLFFIYCWTWFADILLRSFAPAVVFLVQSFAFGMRVMLALRNDL